MKSESSELSDWSIYGLRAVSDTEFSYIGLTHVGIEKRLKIHKAGAISGTRPVHEWLRQNIDIVVAELIQECPVDDTVFIGKAESYWIDYYRDQGHPLTNSAAGGAPGSYGKTWTVDEDKIRRGEDHHRFGKTHSEGVRASMGVQNIGRVRSEESRRKQGESISGDNHWTKKQNYSMSDETRAKISASLKGRKVSPEARRKISESLKGVSPTPEALANLRASFKRGEDHHAYGKPALNRGVSPSEESLERMRQVAPARSCKSWHINRGYVDPDCASCVERVESGIESGFSTPEEIEAAKELWKSKRDTTELSARLSAQRKGRVTSDETRARISAATKGVKKSPVSDETRAKQSAAAIGRKDSEETKRKKRNAQHIRRHVEEGVVNPDCEFCV